MRTARTGVGRLSLSVGVLLAAVCTALGQGGVNVTTWHNDNWRTGQNNSEGTLTPTNVGNNFGLVCSFPTQGQVYTQPLVVAHTNDAGMEVYIADMDDYVYDFTIPAGWNGTCTGAGGITWTSVNLLANDQNEYPVDCCFIGSEQCATISPTVGVLGTPTVDTSTSTLYLVAESQVGSTGQPGQNCANKKTSPTNWVHRLHAIDISSPANFGNEKYNGPATFPPVKINPNAQFQSQQLIQRPGLLFSTEAPPAPAYPTIYVAFSMMDDSTAYPSGWIFAYDAQNLATGALPIYYALAPNYTPAQKAGAGVWQGGAGLASGSDENGGPYLYFSTANGYFDLENGSPDSADSLIKLQMTLQPPTGYPYYFTPSDQVYRQCFDLDYGSGGVLLIPDSLSSTNRYAVKGEKEDYLFIMDRTRPGGYTGSPTCGTCNYGVPGGCGTKQNPCTACTTPNNNLPEPPIQFDTYSLPNDGPFARATPAFWSGSVLTQDLGELYYPIPGGQLQRYPVVGPTGSCSQEPHQGNPPVCNAAVTGNDSIVPDHTGYSGTPSISSLYSGGTYQNGIAWLTRTESSALGCNRYAILQAYDASSLDEIYNSYNTNGRDYNACVGCGEKFSVPTVANGYVFVGTQSALNIFGLNPNQPQQSCTK